jgi:hypothetical protein
MNAQTSLSAPRSSPRRKSPCSGFTTHRVITMPFRSGAARSAACAKSWDPSCLYHDPILSFDQGSQSRARGDEETGLARGKDNPKVYVVYEIPSNVTVVRAFAESCDGFSIAATTSPSSPWGSTEILGGSQNYSTNRTKPSCIRSNRSFTRPAKRALKSGTAGGAERLPRIRRISRRLRHRFDVREP